MVDAFVYAAELAEFQLVGLKIVATVTEFNGITDNVMRVTKNHVILN